MRKKNLFNCPLYHLFLKCLWVGRPIMILEVPMWILGFWQFLYPHLIHLYPNQTYRFLDHQVEKYLIHFGPFKYLQLGYHKVYVMRCQNEEDFFTLISYHNSIHLTKYAWLRWTSSFFIQNLYNQFTFQEYIERFFFKKSQYGPKFDPRAFRCIYVCNVWKEA